MDSWFNVTIRKHFFTACILMLLCTFVPSFTSAQSQNNGSNTSLNQVTTPSSSFFDFASNLSFERIISPFKNSFNFVVDKTANFIQPIFTISVSNVDNSGTTNGTNNQQSSKAVESKTNQKNLFNSTSSSLTVTKNYLLQIGAGLEQGSSSNVNNGSQETSSKSYFATLQKDTADIAKAVASSNNVAAQNSSNSNAVIKNILTRVSNLEATPRVVQIINTYPQNNTVSNGGGISVEAFNALSTSVSRALDSFNRNTVAPSIASAVNNFNTNVIGDVFSTSTTRAVLSAGDNLLYDSANGVFSLSTSTVQAMVVGLGQSFSTSTTRAVFSNTVTGLSYNNSTGITSLTSGYNIPLTASTTEWASTVASIASLNTTASTLTSSVNTLNASTTNLSTFYQTPSARITAGTGLAWSGNTINSTGVTSFGGFSGAVATSSFSTSDFMEGSNLYFTNVRADARANIQIGLATSTIQAMVANSVSTSTVRGMFSATATGLTYNNSTGITSLTSGYNIPTTASTTEWANKVGSQWTTSGANISYSAGNVGIGTTGPQGKLDVAGQTLIGNGDRTAQSTYPLYISDSSNLGWKVADGSGVSKFELYAGFGGTNEMRLLNGVSLIGYGQNLTLGTSQNGSALTILDNASGNVGIGTTTPGTKLSVVGAANFTGNVTASAFYGDGSNLTGITSFSTSTTRGVFSNTATGLTYDNSTGVTSLTSGYNIPLTASTTEWANKVGSQWTASGGSVSYSGDVGIGTTNSNEGALKVAGSVYSTAAETDSVLNGGGPGWQNMANFIGTGGWWGLRTATDHSFNLDMLNSNALTVKQTGFVGIGSSTPSSRLTVSGDINFTGALRANGNPGTTGMVLLSNGSSAPTWVATSTLGITSFATSTTRAVFSNTATGLTYDNSTGVTSLTSGYNIPLTASTTEWANKVSSQWTASGVNISYAGGNVGIGTTTPANALTVMGNGHFTSGLSVGGTAATTTGTRVSMSAGSMLQYSGSEPNPRVNLAISSISNGVPGLVVNSAPSVPASQTGAAVGQSTQNTLSFYVSNGSALTERARFDTTGFFGIGTTTPVAVLSVQGSTTNPTVPLFTIASSTTAQLFTVAANGNVGIASSTPSSKLTVAGDINFTGALRANGDAGTTGMVLLSNGTGASPTWVATSTLGISGGGASLTGTTGQFAFFSGTNTAVGTSTLFLSNGNIGIGTTTPASALSVVGAGNFTSDLTTRGLLNILGTGTSTVNSDILLSGDIVPSADNTYRLGTPSRMWRDVYIGPGSLYVNGQKVLQTDVSNNVTITADSNQNLVLKSAGTGDLELNPSGTGQILLKGNVRLSAGKTITTSDASPLVLTNGADLGFLRVASNTITPTNLNGGITIAATGTGGVYFTQGNVGIATTSPAYPLTVSGDINFTGALRANGNPGTTGMVLLSNGSSAPTWVATSTLGISSGSSLTGTTGQFAFFSGTNTAVGTSTLFLSNGNIGIGTTTPTARLSISGSAGVTDLLNIASSTSASLFKIGATGATYFNNDAGTTGMVLLSNGTGASPTWMATSSLGISGGGSSQWTTSGSDIYYNTGKVKIGADTNNFLATNFSAGAVTSVPSYSNSGGSGNRTSTVTVSSTLTPGTGTVANLVDGSQAFNLWWSGSVAGSYIRFDFGAGQSKLITEATFYESSAVSQGVWKWQGSNDASTWTDIGSSFTLGATAPQTITELSGNTTGYRYYQLLGISGSTSSGPYIQEFEFKIDNYTSATYAGMQTYTTNGVTAGGSIALQTSGGSVGIGTASPLSKLDINGGVAIGSYAGVSAAPGNGLIVSGNVGIGTTTPTAKLAITGTAGTGDIFAVASSTDARLFTVTANGNVGIGTTTPGSSLVVQGSGAFTGKMTLLDTVSSSVGGIYFGSNQFLHNYGTRNTFTGSASGNFTLTGTDNTGNGINALGALTSGHSNAALGSNAGNGITSGVRNVAIGYYAIGGGGGSTGNDNVAIGYGVGSATSVTGAGNVGVGMYAIRTLSSGNYNVALGYGAGEAAGTAANNVFVGKAAGSLTTGSNNIMIGYQAGANLVTGTKNIIIGYDISATSSTMTNGLNIGNLIFGTGLDGSATTLSTGKIGIGSTTPYAKLTVAGEAYADLFTAGSTTATSTFAGGLNVGNGALTYNWATGLTNITNASLGAMTFDSDSGMVSWVDMPVTSTSASGTVQSYTAQLDGNPMLSIYGLSDGAGAVNTLRVGVGTTTPVSTFAVAGTINASNLVGGASLSADASGNIILTPSDERLKQDIKPIESALDKLMKLQGVTFDWKDKERFGSSTEIGFIAQDVQKIVPEVIRQGPEYMSLNYSNMVALVVEAVKELKTRVDAVLGWFSPSGDRINIKGMVCVDDVCVTKDQFKQMLMNSGSVMVIPQTSAPASTEPAPTTSTAPDTSLDVSSSTGDSTPVGDTSSSTADSTSTSDTPPVSEPIPTPEPTPAPVESPATDTPTSDSPAL